MFLRMKNYFSSITFPTFIQYFINPKHLNQIHLNLYQTFFQTWRVSSVFLKFVCPFNPSTFFLLEWNQFVTFTMVSTFAPLNLYHHYFLNLFCNEKLCIVYSVTLSLPQRQWLLKKTSRRQLPFAWKPLHWIQKCTVWVTPRREIISIFHYFFFEFSIKSWKIYRCFLIFLICFWTYPSKRKKNRHEAFSMKNTSWWPPFLFNTTIEVTQK